MKKNIYHYSDYEVVRKVSLEEEKDRVGLDDIINVNGMVGYLEFIGQDMIAIVDTENNLHKIMIKDIRFIKKISGWISGNMASVPIKSLLNVA